MGKILRTKKLTTLSELLIVVVLLGGILGATYYYAPGLRVGEAKVLDGMNVDKTNVDNVITSAKMELPGTSRSSKVEDKPLVKIAAYAWNAQSGIIVSNGGPRTTKGSLMEQNGCKPRNRPSRLVVRIAEHADEICRGIRPRRRISGCR